MSSAQATEGLPTAASGVQTDLQVVLPSVEDRGGLQGAAEAEATHMSIASVKTAKSFDADQLHFDPSPSPSPRSPPSPAYPGAHDKSDSVGVAENQLPSNAAAEWEVRSGERGTD